MAGHGSSGTSGTTNDGPPTTSGANDGPVPTSSFGTTADGVTNSTASTAAVSVSESSGATSLSSSDSTTEQGTTGNLTTEGGTTEPPPPPPPPPPGICSLGGYDLSISYLFFVSKSYDGGEAKGVVGATEKCEEEATGEGGLVSCTAILADTGFKDLAWLVIGKTDGPVWGYVVNDGKSEKILIADGLAALLEQSICSAVEQIRPLSGESLNGDQDILVWTGIDGAGKASSERCVNWTSALPADHGQLGLAGKEPMTQEWRLWHAGANAPCDKKARIYCLCDIKM